MTDALCCYAQAGRMVQLQGELVPVTLLGTAALVVFLGYFTHSFVSEAVLHSVSRRHHQIDEYAGYYGQAVQFVSFAIFCLFAPSIVHRLSSKVALIATAILFALFFAGYLYLNQYYYYISQALVGLGYAIFNNAEGAYLSEHSSAYTIEWNTALETAIGHGGQLLSGVILLAASAVAESENRLDEQNRYFDYSDTHIRVLYGSFLAMALLSVLLFLALPSANSADSIAASEMKTRKSLVQQLRSNLECAYSMPMLVLTPFFLHQGAFTAFFLGVYPTSFSFDDNLESGGRLVAYFCIGIGIGEIIGGTGVGWMSKRIQSFSLLPSMAIHYVLFLAVQGTVLLTTPCDALIRPTSATPLLFTLNVMGVLALGVGVGICDCCVTTSRSVICQLVLPNQRMEAFSISKLIQSLAGGIVFLLSPKLLVWQWSATFFFISTVGFVTFCFTGRRLKSR